MKHPHPRHTALLVALSLSLGLLGGCDRWHAWEAAYADLTRTFRGPNVPDPVQSKDGLAYIPIDDTAFLIPEKTWLKGYARNLTDGLVSHIGLHTTVPDVQPWSQARHEEMYWRAGPGKKLLIDIKGNEVGDYRDNFHKVPSSRMWEFKFIEEPSDQASQGLRRFRRAWSFYKDEAAINDAIRRNGREFVEEMRRDAGKPMMDTVYYEYIQNDRVKYFIHCGDSPGPIWHSCNLSFPWARTLMIDIEFNRADIGHIVAMADKVSERLREFEAAGLARKASQTPPITPTPNQ